MLKKHSKRETNWVIEPTSLSSSTFSKCHIVIDAYWLPLPFLIRIVKLSPKGMVVVCSDKYFQRRATKKEAHGKKGPS